MDLNGHKSADSIGYTGEKGNKMKNIIGGILFVIGFFGLWISIAAMEQSAWTVATQWFTCILSLLCMVISAYLSQE